MQSLYVRVIATVMGLSFTGTMANTPETSNIFFNSECQGDVYLLINFTRNLGHVDVSQISITEDVSFSFFRPFLWSNMESEVWDSKHLDLSNNLIPKIALHVLAYLRSLEGLNLSNNAIRFISLDPQSHRSSCPKYRRSRDYLPLLKVLILQRNKLWAIPKGLWKLKSLKSLDLSFNEISQIHFTDFHNCRELENLYLQSNRIFSIHPEAFKNLKKLQTVDLSSNALTAILPMMTIALALPHMDVDLADNQWQCDSSIAFFQNFLSESWRETWSEICNKSIRNEEASQWIPKSKISKATHFSDSHLNHGKKLPTSHTERPQEGVSKSLSIAGEKQRRMPRWVRDARDDQTLGRQKEGPSQDLTLAVCLSVFITFFVAFCLGALARPFIDRLWRQRCQNKSSGPKIAHPNEGFYDEIEGTGDRQPPATSLGQALNGMNLYENQDSLSVMPSPHTAVTHDRASVSNRTGPGRLENTTQCGNNAGSGSRNNPRPTDSVASPGLHGHLSVGYRQAVPDTQNPVYRSDILGEVNYENVAREASLNGQPISIPQLADRFQTVSGSIRDDSNELNPPLAGETTASLSKVLMKTSPRRAGEKAERGSNEQIPSGTPSCQLEISKDGQTSARTNLLSSQQQTLTGTNPEEESSVYYSAVAHHDLQDNRSSAFPPRWGSDPDATAVHEESLQHDIPSDSQGELEMDSDSDEGSLFTLSSTSSEGAGDVTEETRGEDSYRTSEPLDNERSEEQRDNEGSLESLEDNPGFQNILEKCKTKEDDFGNTLISGPDAGSQQAGSNTEAGNRNYNLFPHDSAAHVGVTFSHPGSHGLYSVYSPNSGAFPHGQPSTDSSQQILPTQDYISGSDILEEVNYETGDPDVLDAHSMFEVQQTSSSGINTVVEDPLTSSRSPCGSPVSVELPGMFIYDYIIDPESEAVEWLYSLRDLEFSNVDILPQTPPYSPEVPSDPDERDSHERDSDISQHEPFVQRMDTVRPLRFITGGNERLPHRDSEGHGMEFTSVDTDAVEFGHPLEDSWREVIGQTQSLQPCGDESAPHCERGKEEFFKGYSKHQAPLFQELPDRTNSLRTPEHFEDRDWGEDSEDNLLQLEEESNSYTQKETERNQIGLGVHCEEHLYDDSDKDV